MAFDLHLCAQNAEMAAAWREHFAGVAGVEISEGNILELRGDAIVSPANSFGHMDGGIDKAYVQFFGSQLQRSVRAFIEAQSEGELPVGRAVVVPTGDDRIPHLVSAPTMRVPGQIADTVNVYLAFRAALLAVLRHNGCTCKPVRNLLSPAMGTGAGAMPLDRAARQMFAAYSEVVLGDHKWRHDAAAIRIHHEMLLR